MEKLNTHLNEQPAQVQKSLNYYADLLDDIVNVGLNIIKNDYKSKDFIENAPRKMLLRHFLELIDATSILIRNRSIQPAHHTLRNALEGFLLLKFLLFDNVQEKSKAYIVANMMEFKEIVIRMKEDGRKDFKDVGMNKTVDEMIDYYEKSMSSVEYKEVYKRLKELKGNQKNWYKIFSVNSIKDIAEKINESVWYNSVYSSLSARTHGSDTIAGNMTDAVVGGDTYIKDIRQTDQAVTVTNFAITISVHCFDYYVNKNLSHFSTEYNAWRNQIVDKRKNL